MSTPFIISKHPSKNWLTYPLLGLGLLTLSACSTTQKARIDQTSVNCGLLGRDCATRLVTGGEDQIGLRHINPAAQWTHYKQVLINPVTFWGNDSTQVSAADQQALVNYFSEQLHEQLGKQFRVVQQAGPDTLKIDVAMTDAETATPVLRSVSMIVPQAHLLSNLKYLATGTFPFVGGAQAEIRITDSETGKVLAEGLDKRIGGGAFRSGFQWQWGDAENAIITWSEMLAKRLAAWTSGAETPQ